MSIFKPPFATAEALDGIVLEEGELAWDTTNKKFRMGDGVTLGGKPDPVFGGTGVSQTTFDTKNLEQDTRLDTVEADVSALETAQGLESIVGTVDEIDVSTIDPLNPVISISPNFTGGASAGLDWSGAKKTAGFTAEVGKGYLVDSSLGPYTVAFPPNPVGGDEFALRDQAGTWDRYPITGDAGLEPIEGQAQSWTGRYKNQFVRFLYDTEKGWLPTSVSLTPLADVLTTHHVTGGWSGGGIQSMAGNTLIMRPFRVKDDTESVWLVKDTTTELTISSDLNGQVYNIFAVRYSDNTFGYEVDIDSEGANLPGTVTEKRYDCFVRTNGSGVPCLCGMQGNTIRFAIASENNIANPSSTYATIDHSTVIPESRIKLILYGSSGATGSADLMTSLNGSAVEAIPSRSCSSAKPDTDTDAWGDNARQGNHLPYSPDRMFKCNTASFVRIREVVLFR